MWLDLRTVGGCFVGRSSGVVMGVGSVEILARYCSLIALTFVAPGCSLHSMTGDVMGDYGRAHLIPHLLEYGDTGMACQTGASLGGFLASFERVTEPNHSTLIPTYMSAAICAEADAREHVLRGLRATRRGDLSEVADAEIAAKTAFNVAALRFKSAYKHVLRGYGNPNDGCPELSEDYDEMVWLLGLVSGLQGLQYDQMSGGRAGFSLNLPVQVARGAKCLDNQKWWGVPNAVQAAVSTAVPSEAGRFEDPWAVMKESATLGHKKGVRLASAIVARAAHGAGNETIVMETIKAHAASLTSREADRRYATIDGIATSEVIAISDALWTQSTGHRTPYGELGVFPGEDDAEEAEDEAFLDDLE